MHANNIIYFFLLIINLIIFLKFRPISNYLNIFDLPDGKRKIHKKAVALLGGPILIINFLIIYFLSNFYQDIKFTESKIIFFIFLVASLLVFLLGLLDDKLKLHANLKLFMLASILIGLCVFNNNIIITELRFSFYEQVIYLNSFSIFFTVFCFLLFINAFNMFDGINMQCGIYSLTIFIYLILSKLDIQLLFLMAIPLIFFLFLNYNNNCFLGDSGTYFLSFFISYIIVYNYNNQNLVYADEIFLLMAIPGYELLRLAILRIYKKKHPFAADNLHIHHLILKKKGILFTNLLIQILIILPLVFTFIYSINIVFIIISATIYGLTIFFFSK